MDRPVIILRLVVLFFYLMSIAPASAQSPSSSFSTLPAARLLQDGSIAVQTGNLYVPLVDHVPNNAALQSRLITSASVERDGFASPNDGGHARYVHFPTPCAVVDNGACVKAADGGSWVIAETALSPLQFGAKCKGADDVVPMQAALYAASLPQPLGAQPLQLVPRGMTCAVSTALIVKSNTHLRIDGKLLMLPGSNALATPIINYYASINASYTTSNTGGDTNIVVEGDGTIDGNAQAQTATSPLGCVYIYGPTSYFTMKGLTLVNCTKGSPISIGAESVTPGVGASHVHLSYMTVIGGGSSSQFAVGCDDCTADHMTFLGSNDYPWAFYGMVTNSSLTNSRVVGGSGVGIINDGDCSVGQPNAVPTNHITVAHNFITGSAAAAIMVQNNTVNCPAVRKHAHLEFIGNQGYGNNLGNNANLGGEYIDAATDVTSIGNIWHNDGPLTPPQSVVPSAGVDLTARVEHYTSIGDHVFDEGQPASGLGIGFVIAPGATYLTFDSPQIYDDQLINTTSAQASTNSTTLLVSSANNIVAGMSIVGYGIPTGTTIASVVGNTLTLSKAATVALFAPLAITGKPTMAYAFNGQCISGAACVVRDPVIGPLLGAPFATMSFASDSTVSSSSLNQVAGSQTVFGNQTVTGSIITPGPLAVNGANGQMTLGSTSAPGAPAFLAYSSGSSTQDFTFQFAGGTPGTTNTGSLIMGGGNLRILSTITAPNLATVGGAVKGSVCSDTSGYFYVKTTTGPCL